MARPSISTNRPVLLSVAFIVMTSVVALLPAWKIVWSQWTRLGSYEHGLIIAVLVCALIFRRANRLGGPITPLSQWLFLPAAMGLVIVSAVSHLAVQLSFELFAVATIPIILSLAIFVAIGQNSKPFAISTLPFYLYCALPIWEQFSTVLQSITVFVVSSVLTALGVLAYIDGTFVYLSDGTFEIAQGCSGLRFFLTAAAIGLFYSAFTYLDFLKGSLLICLMLALSLVLNWVRVAAIVISGELLGMDTYIVRSHYFFGWLLFVAGLIALFYVANRLDLLDNANRSDRARARNYDCDVADPE